MSKRKAPQELEKLLTNKVSKTNGHVDVRTTVPVIQIITGSYERVLHGFTASITNLSSPKTSPSVAFTDSFLFNAHSSAIRCLALSPLPELDSTETQGVYLASGGSDERINVYSLSAAPPAEDDKMPSMPTLGKNKISENPRNRELGSVLQHSSSITALYFPTRSKLLSASEDNTIAISRTKDLTVVSTVKAPHPKVQGQPSGDTAPPGATPAGVNDFSVHPSMKLMVSVGKGEKCMRLWNLVTGKKAGVLNFPREVLQSVKESKYSSGEGRRIRWSPSGSEFTVAFERGAVMFGEDSRPLCKALPMPLTKLHQVSYFKLQDGDNDVLAVSTEDGRILFYSTPKTTSEQESDAPAAASLPDADLIATLGGKIRGITGRIKDFEIIQIPAASGSDIEVVIITASSDGAIRVWKLLLSDLITKAKSRAATVEPRQVGEVIGTYETGSRVTCLKVFLMQDARSDEGLLEFEGLTEDDAGSSSSSDSDEE